MAMKFVKNIRNLLHSKILLEIDHRIVAKVLIPFQSQRSFNVGEAACSFTTHSYAGAEMIKKIVRPCDSQQPFLFIHSTVNISSSNIKH